MPINTHCAIKWSADNPMEKMPEINDAEWHIVHKGRQVLEPREADNESLISMGFVAAKGSIPVNNQIFSSVNKRKTENLHVSTNKRRKLTDHMHPLNVQQPVGLIWDGQNYSCAYDSMFTILYSIWIQDPEVWTKRFEETSQMLTYLASEFHNVLNGHKLLEAARDIMRTRLYNIDHIMFPCGLNGCSISNLAEKLLLSEVPVASVSLECKFCPLHLPVANERTTYIVHTSSPVPNTTTGWWEHLLRHVSQHHCHQCLRPMDKVTAFNDIPNILMVTIGASMIGISEHMTFKDGETLIHMKLCGIMYFGDFHFTSCIIDSNENV